MNAKGKDIIAGVIFSLLALLMFGLIFVSLNNSIKTGNSQAGIAAVIIIPILLYAGVNFVKISWERFREASRESQEPIRITKKYLIITISIIIIIVFIIINDSVQVKLTREKNLLSTEKTQAHDACIGAMYQRIPNMDLAMIFRNNVLTRHDDGSYFDMIPIKIPNKDGVPSNVKYLL